MADQIVNPLLAKLQLPGRIFPLPSGGYSYHNGELGADIVDGEIHVHPMSAIAEINLKNPDMLFSGQAVDKVFKECIPGIKKPLELFGKDVDAIMCFLRIVTYGTKYEVAATHQCDKSKCDHPHFHPQNHTYEIDLEELLTKTVQLDPTKDAKTVVLDNGQVVIIDPMRFKHIVEMLQALDKEKKLTPEENQASMIKNMLNAIRSVDDITDKKFIEGWLRAISSKQLAAVAQGIEEANEWGIEYVVQVQCKDCGETFDLEVPVNPVSFFSE